MGAPHSAKNLKQEKRTHNGRAHSSKQPKRPPEVEKRRPRHIADCLDHPEQGKVEVAIRSAHLRGSYRVILALSAFRSRTGRQSGHPMGCAGWASGSSARVPFTVR